MSYDPIFPLSVSSLNPFPLAVWYRLSPCRTKVYFQFCSLSLTVLHKLLDTSGPQMGFEIGNACVVLWHGLNR